jgi:hypothetical protein
MLIELDDRGRVVAPGRTVLKSYGFAGYGIDVGPKQARVFCGRPRWAAGAAGVTDASWTQCGSTIAPYDGTADAINTQIRSCGPNQFVLLGAGTFHLSSSIDLQHKGHFTLRGSGASAIECEGYTLVVTDVVGRRVRRVRIVPTADTT